jgi:hypothetical protein
MQKQNSEEPKNKFSQKLFWWSRKYFTYMSIIIKQTYCQNLTVSSALVLVLFKILYCWNDKFMSNILLRDGAKYVKMNGIKNWEYLDQIWFQFHMRLFFLEQETIIKQIMRFCRLEHYNNAPAICVGKPQVWPAIPLK